METLGAVTEPTLSLHCTQKFDETQSDTDYEECWNDRINRKHFHLIAEDICVGPQGAAAAAFRLPDQLSQWFQVKDSVPHVTLMKTKGYESHELGPMIKQALQVQTWISPPNQNIHISADKQFIRIANKTGDQGKAEGIYLDNWTGTQMACSAQQETLLQQVPNCLWSQHKTDVGLVEHQIHIRYCLTYHQKLGGTQ